MIKLFRKMFASTSKKNRTDRYSVGAATLIMTVILLVMSTLIIIFAANYGRIQSAISANNVRSTQAFEAAEAGIEFGIKYLTKNSSTIVANPVSGYIPVYSDSSTTNVVLLNNSRFSVTFRNPIANNYEIIRITSTGTSDDGSSTRVIVQDVKFGSLLVTTPTFPLAAKGGVTMGGNAQVTNLSSGTTIVSGSTVSISGAASTEISSGTGSTSSSTGSDVQQNNTTLSGQSQNDFFARYFGVQSGAVQGAVDYVYNNSVSTNYSSTLAGKTGASIWINQTGGTASIDGNTTIGSASSPVLLIVNGSFSLSGNVTIYGFIFVIGENAITTFTGNTSIIGGIATTETLDMNGSIEVTYDSSVLNNLRNEPSMRYYARIPGSWRDF